MSLRWMQSALCATVDPSLFFPSKGGDNGYAARDLCRVCHVREACLRYAMQLERGAPSNSRFGVWGGATPYQRRKAELRITSNG